MRDIFTPKTKLTEYRGKWKNSQKINSNPFYRKLMNMNTIQRIMGHRAPLLHLSGDNHLPARRWRLPGTYLPSVWVFLSRAGAERSEALLPSYMRHTDKYKHRNGKTTTLQKIRVFERVLPCFSTTPSETFSNRVESMERLFCTMGNHPLPRCADWRRPSRAP